MIELIDLYLEVIFCGWAFLQNKYQIICKFSTKFCCTLPQLHVAKVNFIRTLISMPTIGGNVIDLTAFLIILVYYFLKLSPSFATCNSQLQGVTATLSALLLFAHFCVSMTPFALWLLFLKEFVAINIDIPELLLCLTYKKTLNKYKQ